LSDVGHEYLREVRGSQVPGVRFVGSNCDQEAATSEPRTVNWEPRTASIRLQRPLPAQNEYRSEN
jgi:hypothetical protein